VLTLAPWAAEDPLIGNPKLSLAERRAILTRFGKQLLPGGARANEYPEAAIWADVEVSIGA